VSSRKLAEDAPRGIESVEGRQHKVHDDHIRPQALRGEHCFLAGRGGSHNLHLILVEQNREPRAHDTVVIHIDQDDAARLADDQHLSWGCTELQSASHGEQPAAA
jgi:hypothetical protein